MNAIELLKNQHAEVKALFQKLESATETAEKNRLFAQLADNFAAHATIEEQIFYPVAYKGKLRDVLPESIEEHLAAKGLVAELLEMKAGDEAFDAKVKVLREQIELHVQEEESDFFPKAQNQLGSIEMNRLGGEMERLFETLKQGEPRADMPQETDEAAPVH